MGDPAMAGRIKLTANHKMEKTDAKRAENNEVLPPVPHS
jgi:hypothetical protein